MRYWVVCQDFAQGPHKTREAAEHNMALVRCTRPHTVEETEDSLNADQVRERFGVWQSSWRDDIIVEDDEGGV